MFSKSIMMKRFRWFRCLFICVVLVYLNVVLSNVISWRQTVYAKNGTSMAPLHDSLFIDWFGGHELPAQDMFTVRDLVDVCTFGWVGLASILWCFVGTYEQLTRVVTAEMVLVPSFAIAQLMTVVPDSTPNCLETYDIPRGEDTSWIFWRYPLRTCGNMLWSSDLAQLLIFVQLTDDLVTSRCWSWATWMVSRAWVVLTTALILTSRYQYSVDVVATFIVVRLAVTHPSLHRLAHRCFIKDSDYFERVPVQELPERRI